MHEGPVSPELTLANPIIDWLVRESTWIERSTDRHFDLGPIYIVGLESRLDHIWRFLEQNGLLGQVSILKAFTPEALAMDEAVDLGLVSPDFPQLFGTINCQASLCCAISHIACWLDAERHEVGSCFFLEDDLALVDERDQVSEVVKLALREPWSAFYLSYSHAEEDQCRLINDHLLELKGQLCTNAYALEPSARRDLLNSAFPIFQVVDWYIRTQVERNEWRVIGSRTLLFQQDRATVQSALLQSRQFPAPAWRATTLQKVLAGTYSALTFSGENGYDHAISLIDRQRQGRLSIQETRHPLIRIWKRLDRLTAKREPQPPR
ncbi:glycosyltransferase family 25 protein [Myxococcota bacterium]|nr:glycosyltransferase family 25 protein [Myxococcota bacterium]